MKACLYSVHRSCKIDVFFPHAIARPNIIGLCRHFIEFSIKKAKYKKKMIAILIFPFCYLQTTILSGCKGMPFCERQNNSILAGSCWSPPLSYSG